MNTRNVVVALDLPLDARLRVVSLRLEEGMSRVTRAALEVAAPDDVDFRGMLREEGIVRLEVDGDETRRWALLVDRVSGLGAERGSLRYRVELAAPLHFLRYKTNTRKFREKTAEEIVSAVLAASGVDFVFQLARPTARRKYCSQYRETDLDFVVRLLEFEGIYFTCEPDGSLALGDRSSALPVVDGPSRFDLSDAGGALEADHEIVYALRAGARVAPGTVTVNDFNWKKPNVSLLSTCAAEPDADLEIYEYPAGYRRPDQGELLARLRLEALRAEADVFDGEGNVSSFRPGRVFHFGSAGGAEFEGEHLLLRVEHTFEDPAFASEDGAQEVPFFYRNTFRAIPRSVPFRPPVVTPRPTVQGTHTAMVRGPSGQEIYTDTYGRFRAQFHWDREATGTDADSRWVRKVQEIASGMVLARVGWEMTVAYIDGDPDRPIGLSRNINGVMMPAYAQPANKTVMTIKTRSSPATGGYSEIRLCDSAEAQRFDVRAERDWAGYTLNDKTEWIGATETHQVVRAHTHTVGVDQTVGIGANKVTTTGKIDDLVVKHDRTRTVAGDETYHIGASSSVKVGRNDVESVGGTRKTVVGGAPGAQLIRDAKEGLKRTFASSCITTATGNITGGIHRNYTEDVSGVKSVTAQTGAIVSNVSGTLTLSITGGATWQSGKDLGVGAPRSFIQVGANAAVEAGALFQVTGKTVEIEAQSELVLSSPGATITMTPSSISISSPSTVLDAPETIRVTGNTDNVTG